MMPGLFVFFTFAELLEMAFNYDTSPNGLFIQLGLIAKHYFLQKTDATDLDTDLAAILNTFEAMTSGAPALMVEGFATGVEGWKGEHAGRRETLAGLALTRLQDRVTILDELGLTGTEAADILRALIIKMREDTESVDASTVTIGSTTAAGSNTGSGTVLTSAYLDGVTSPGSGAAGVFAAHPDYNGQLSQLAVPSETMRVVCTADSFADGETEGDEVFAWTGRLADAQHGYASEGTGDAGTLTPINGGTLNILSNGDFETWETNIPTGWTIVAGTATTHVIQENTGADVYHGAYSLQYTGDGAQTSMEVKQPVSPTVLQAGKRYCVACRVKASATIAAGALLISFEGSGYTAAASEKIAIAAGALPTAWTLESFFINLPDIIPSDWALVIRWSGTPTNAKSLWVDDIAFAPVSFAGGIGAVVVRGAVPFIRDDYFTFTVANNDAGLFQKFFRQVFGVQLPSDAAAGETIDDALAS